MPKLLLPTFFSLITFILTSCTPATPPTLTQPTLFYLQGTTLISREWRNGDESSTPLNLPPGCALWSLHPAPRGDALALELYCASGPAVVMLEPTSGEMRPLIDEPGTDSHFFAWDADGQSLYLKIDSLGNARIARVDAESGKLKELPLPATTYDLGLLPSGEIISSQTAGLGFGAETWLSDEKGRPLYRLLVEPEHIVAFARPSPDGKQIAYILMPDGQTPFPLGALWLADAEGQNPQFIAEADAGHGFAPAWSPNGTRIAFVVRENPDDAQTDPSSTNLALVNVAGAEITPITDFEEALVGAPVWSPDGMALSFDVVENGKMSVWVYDAATGELFQVSESGTACCPAWTER